MTSSPSKHQFDKEKKKKKKSNSFSCEGLTLQFPDCSGATACESIDQKNSTVSLVFAAGLPLSGQFWQEGEFLFFLFFLPSPMSLEVGGNLPGSSFITTRRGLQTRPQWKNKEKKKKPLQTTQRAATSLPLLGLPCFQPAQTMDALICPHPCRVLQSEEFHIYTQYCTNYPR